MVSFGMTAQQRQNVRLIPQQITFNTVLEMNVGQLQQHVQAEVMENPALDLVEVPHCPVCSAPMETSVCWECGAPAAARDGSAPSPAEDWALEMALPRGPLPEDDWDPLSFVAAAWGLRDDLKVQLALHLSDEALSVGDFIIESLDDDGYFRDELIDVADRFCWSVPQVEEVLRCIQSLEPPGVGARDLQECLLLQLRRFPEEDDQVSLALRILTEAFKPFSTNRLDRVAKDLSVSLDQVSHAAEFIRQNLAPCPGRNFRVSWQHLSPSRNRASVPDVCLRFEGDKLVAEVVELRSWRLQLEAQYARLEQAMQGRRGAFSSEDRQHVRHYVGRARALTEALAQRRRTLQRVALFVGEAQRQFLLLGPEALKPLTKKQVAQAMGLHESTVCRATLHKFVQLPNGEVTSFDTFFDGSLSPKETLRRIIAEEPPERPFSDGEVARRMALAGFRLARRTVAKYRDALGVPPMEMRRRV